MPVQFQYSDFNGNETTVLFYAISINNGPEHQIMKHEFVSDISGSGIVHADWNVPWNLFFASQGPNNALIVVRASNIVSTTYTTQSFGLTMFTDSDGILMSPSNNEVILTDVPYNLTWDHLSLHYFNPIAWQSYDGKNVVTEAVSFEVVGENVHVNGTILSTSTYHNLVQAPVSNNGSLMVVFPSNLTRTGNRFYIKVYSVSKYNIYGWSKGYFYLQPLLATLGVKVNEKSIQSRAVASKIVHSHAKKMVSKVFFKDSPTAGVVASSPSTSGKSSIHSFIYFLLFLSFKCVHFFTSIPNYFLHFLPHSFIQRYLFFL